ncbi:MAG: hypothetical protein HKO10_02040 [Acidimicrobiia bacterium]|nr:hypothetical protein [Acidimicrobiia bacterium]
MNSISTFANIRQSIIHDPPAGRGRDIGELLSSALDDALIASTTDLDQSLSLVALGSYGRREMCIHSDIDLMILTQDRSPATTKEAVNAVFYPLWDSGLRVGHSIRTVHEAIVASRDSFETLCSLLTARLVMGDPARFTHLQEEVAQLIRKRPITESLKQEERLRRASHPWPIMSIDLKTGRSGLRTAQAIEWDRQTSGSSADAEGLRTAVDDLLAVRNSLHATNDRAIDALVLDVRSRAARWLGMSTKSMIGTAQRAIRAIEREARRQWPDLDQQKPTGVRSRFRAKPALAPKRTTVIAQAADAAEGRRLLTERELERASIESGHWNAENRGHLYRLIAHPEIGWQIFDQLVEVGWVDRSIGTWTHTVALPQMAPFHEHPTDIHLWRTVAEMQKLLEPHSEERWTSELGATLDHEQLLFLAWVHDIGKGFFEDHSAKGSRIMAALGTRLGIEGQRSARFQKLIEIHLLLANTAMRRDTSDSETIEHVADQVGDPETLQMLYLLTIADAKATGNTMWTEWKATQVRSLYAKVDARLGGSEITSPDQADPWFDDEEQLLHESLIERALGKHEVRLAFTGKAPLYVLTVVTRDHPGLLSVVTGVMAIHNISVRGARLNTTEENIAVDVFQVANALTVDEIGPERIDAFASDLERALAGSLNVGDTLAKKAGHYDSGLGTHVRTRIKVTPAAGATVVEIKTGDRFGLLHDLCRSIADTGLDIHLAMVETRGPEAIDVFYLTETDGSRVSGDHVIELTERISEATGS